MKFSLISTKGPGRLGTINKVVRIPNFELETPHAFLHTQNGVVPHLTYEVLQKLTTDNLGLNICVSSVSNLQNRLKMCKLSVSEFIGMKEYFSYCTFINPGEKKPKGFNENTGVSLWTRNGRKLFSPDEYMKLMEDLKPDMFVVLADGNTLEDSGRKRVVKAVNNSLQYFEKCLTLYKKSEALKNSQIVGALEGGFDVEERENFSKIIGESDVFGVALDGLHDCSENVAEINLEKVREVVEASLKHIPPSKLRIIHGCWNPEVVLDLVELGIDIFDTSFPFYMTEKGLALTFPNTDVFLRESQPKCSKANEPTVKKIKLSSESKYCMSMMDKVLVTDFSPILNNCTCYACKNHMRSYIHHLITVEEMLGFVLLTMHNLHHYFLFLSSVRKALKAGEFAEFKKLFKAWVNEIDDISS